MRMCGKNFVESGVDLGGVEVTIVTAEIVEGDACGPEVGGVGELGSRGLFGVPTFPGGDSVTERFGFGLAVTKLATVFRCFAVPVASAALLVLVVVLVLDVEVCLLGGVGRWCLVGAVDRLCGVSGIGCGGVHLVFVSFVVVVD
jgi:hypothetical protein